MAVKTVPVKFESHGREFDTADEAVRFDALHEARESLKEAQRRFQNALAQSCKTADGKQFDFGTWTGYFYLITPFHTMPYLGKADFFCWNWTVREHDDVIEIRSDPTDARKERASFVPINELYASQKAAEVALLAAQRKWLAEREQEIKDFAEKVSA